MKIVDSRLPDSASINAARWPRGVAALGLSCAALGAGAAPVLCAEMQARIEKQLAAKGAAHPPLKIVPKGLAGGLQVLGSCENGTQRIVYQRAPAAASEPSGAVPAKPAKLPKP